MKKSKNDILRIIRPRFETDEAALNWFENEELPVSTISPQRSW